LKQRAQAIDRHRYVGQVGTVHRVTSRKMSVTIVPIFVSLCATTPPGMSEATLVLNAIETGNAKAADQLLPLVYNELRRLAASKMTNEAAGQTLQPTALVHEAWLRLVGNQTPKFQNRAHFFAAAAEAMRRILIERARQKRAARRGGGHRRVELELVELPFPGDVDQLVAVNEALEQLAAAHPVEAEVVKLRYFVGLTHDEVAEVLGISVRTAKYYWAHARAWLFHEITAAAG
jgi:RNA polymerase sigma factor (TIGR02999 family)